MNLGFNRSKIDRIANDNAFVTPLQAIAQAQFHQLFLMGNLFRTQFIQIFTRGQIWILHYYYRRATGKISETIKLS